MFFNSKPPNILVNESPSQALSLVSDVFGGGNRLESLSRDEWSLLWKRILGLREIPGTAFEINH